MHYIFLSIIKATLTISKISFQKHFKCLCLSQAHFYTIASWGEIKSRCVYQDMTVPNIFFPFASTIFFPVFHDDQSLFMLLLNSFITFIYCCSLWFWLKIGMWLWFVQQSCEFIHFVYVVAPKSQFMFTTPIGKSLNILVVELLMVNKLWKTHELLSSYCCVVFVTFPSSNTLQFHNDSLKKLKTVWNVVLLQV